MQYAEPIQERLVFGVRENRRVILFLVCAVIAWTGEGPRTRLCGQECRWTNVEDCGKGTSPPRWAVRLAILREWVGPVCRPWGRHAGLCANLGDIGPIGGDGEGFAGVLDEAYVTVHKQHVGATGDVVEGGWISRNYVPHGCDGGLAKG